MSHLSEDLADIVSDYTDLKTLEILNKIDPKIYTSDKLFVKKLEGVDRTSILSFAKIYKDVNFFIQNLQKSNYQIKDFRIDPFFLTNAMIQDLFDYNYSNNYHRNNSIINETILKRLKKIYNSIDSDREIIFENIVKNVDKKIYPKFKRFQTEIDFVDTKYICRILHNAYENMMQKTNIYHTTGIHKLIKELTPFVHEIIN
jgi:hypothetical protein